MTLVHSTIKFLLYTLTLFNAQHFSSAQVYDDADNNEDRRKELNNAIYLCTEKIKVNCKDDELKAQLYSDRAAAHFQLGEKFCTFSFTLYVKKKYLISL